MLCTLLTATVLFQQLPEGLPHPSRPVPSHTMRGLTGGDGLYLEETPLWVAVSDRWWSEECRAAGGRREFALDEGSRMGLGELAATAWYESNGIEQVDLRFQITSEGKNLLSGRERVSVGRAMAASDWSSESVVMDLDVEIASAASIADPVMGTRFGGRSLAVHLLPVPGMGWVAECAVIDTAARNSGAIETGNHDIGGIPRLVSELAEAEFSVLLLPNMGATATFPGPNGKPIEIELEAIGAAPPTAKEFGRGSWIDAGAMTYDQQGWYRFLRRFGEGNAQYSNESGAMVLEGDDHAVRADLIGEEIRAAMKPVDITIRWTLEQDGAAVATQSATLSTPAGRELRFAAGNLTRVLEDWDVEVALGSRIPDPIFGDHFGGARCVAAARPAGEGYMLDLDLAFSVVTLAEARILQLGAQSPGRDSSEGEMPSSHQQRVAVDNVVTSTTAFRGSYRLGADGKLNLERSAERMHGEGARIRVEVQVAGK